MVARPSGIHNEIMCLPSQMEWRQSSTAVKRKQLEKYENISDMTE